jgi:hypothetical protein
MGQYAEAAQAYESIVQERANYRSGFNLLLCYHTLGQRDKTRRTFSDLLKIPFTSSEDDHQTSVRVCSFIFLIYYLIFRSIKKINMLILFKKRQEMIV